MHSNSRRYARCLDGSWNGLLMTALSLSHLLEADMDRALAIVPLTARGFVALFELAREPVQTQKHLARGLGVDAGTLSEMLRRLERRGLVRRDPARRGGPRPRPASQCGAVTLTDRGAAVLRRAVAVAAEVEARWGDRLIVRPRGGTERFLGYGLRRWMSEGLAALKAQPGSISKPAAAK